MKIFATDKAKQAESFLDEELPQALIMLDTDYDQKKLKSSAGKTIAEILNHLSQRDKETHRKIVDQYDWHYEKGVPKWVMATLLRLTYLADQEEKDFLLRMFFECKDNDAPYLLLFTKDDWQQDAQSDCLKQIRSGQAKPFDHPFLSENPTEDEKRVAGFITAHQKLGATEMQTGLQGIRFYVDYKSNRIMVGNTLLSPLTKSIGGKVNLNAIELLYGAVLEQANAFNTPESILMSGDENLIKDYQKCMAEAVYTREEIFSILVGLVEMIESPPAIPKADLYGHNIPQNLDTYTNILAKLEEDFEWISKGYDWNVPQSVKVRFEAQRQRLNQLISECIAEVH